MDFMLFFVVFSPISVLCQTLQESGPGLVKPSQKLDLTCTVTGFELTSYSVSWIRQAPGKGPEWIGVIYTGGGTAYSDSLKSRTTITKDNSKKQVYLQINNMEAADSGIYYCARQPFGGGYAMDIWGQGTMVLVTSEKENKGTLLPLIPCCNVFKGEQKLTVGCLLKDAIPLTKSQISWKTGESDIGNAKSVVINGYHAVGSFLDLKTADLKQKPLTCSIDDKKHKLTIPDCTGTVKYPHIEILLPQIDDSTEAAIPLVCYLSDFKPKEIQVGWLKNGLEHDSQTKFKVLRDEDGLFSGTTKLSVSRESWNHGDIYTCKVDIKGQILMHNISKCSGSFVKPVVNLELPSVEDLMYGKGRVVCSVFGTNLDSYKVFLNFDNKNSNARIDTKSRLSVVYIRNVTQDIWKSVKRVSCIAQDTCPTIKEEQSKAVDHTQIKISSPRNEMMASCENKNNSTLICLVSDFWPHDASIAWLKNGQILQDKGKDFTAMLNRKNNMYFGKSSITVQWNEKDIYTCKITHQTQHYLLNSTKCSACPNSFEEPVVDLTLPSSEDLLNGNAKILCLIQVSNLNPSQVSLKFDDKIMKMTSEFAKADKLKDTYKATYTVTKKELKGISTVTCVVKRPCSTVPVEKSKGIEKIIEPRSPDIVTSFGNSNMSTGSIPLLCIISNYWPQTANLVWLKNGKMLDNKDNVFTSMKQENGMYSGNSLLNVPIESWNKDTYLCRVTHRSKDFTEAVRKPQDGYLPTDINTAYEDNGGEELQEAEENNNVWTTTSTFIVLFLVTLIYSSFVTCVKVK